MPDVQVTNRRNLRFHVPDVSIPVQSKRRQNTVLNGRASVFRHKNTLKSIKGHQAVVNQKDVINGNRKTNSFFTVKTGAILIRSESGTRNFRWSPCTCFKISYTIIIDFKCLILQNHPFIKKSDADFFGDTVITEGRLAQFG